MRQKRKQRLILVVLIVLGVGTTVGFSLLALQKNINLFYSPTQVKAGEPPLDHAFRLGGLVVAGSVKRAKQDLTVQFNLTDTANIVPVSYKGILPDLFREGQGIIAQGRLRSDGMFVADQVLAKHDENYMPPEIDEAIKTAHKQAIK